MRPVLLTLALLLAAACGDEGGGGVDAPRFVAWAVNGGLMDEVTAECVAGELSGQERAALVAISPETPDGEIDAGAVESLDAAEQECSAP